RRTALGDLHLEAAVDHRENLDGDDVALLGAAARGRAGRDAATLKLLDAKADALLLDVDVEHLRRNGLAFAMEVESFLARHAPGDVRHVDHAVDVALETDEQAELGRVLDLAFDGRTDRMR